MVRSIQIITLLVMISCLYCTSQVGSYCNHSGDLNAAKDAWELWKREQRKEFRNNLEDLKLFFYFQQNLMEVQEHNRMYLKGEEPYRQNINKYADMGFNRFERNMLGWVRWIKGPISEENNVDGIPLDGELPDHVDWREQGWVTAVKDQNNFASGFAFSAVGALEGHLYNLTGKATNLSAQELLDCSISNKSVGSAVHGLIYASGYGVKSEIIYPYRARKQECVFPGKFSVFRPGSVKILSRNDEEEMKRAVALVGPVSAHIHVNNSFRFYEAGFYMDSTCSEGHMNHAVLVVGYGTDEVWGDYWIVKNSWGADWGQNGYIYMARNSLLNCKIAHFASYPSLAYRFYKN